MDNWLGPLYVKYVNDLYAYGKALGISNENLQDAIHDVFLHVMDRYDTLNITEENVRFYLLRSLKNKLISNMRKKDESCDDISHINEYEFSIKVTGLETLIEKEESQRLTSEIERMLNLLTPRQREAIYLRYMQELSYEEIGEILSLTEKGARKLVSRGIVELRKEQIPLLDIYCLLILLFH